MIYVCSTSPLQARECLFEKSRLNLREDEEDEPDEDKGSRDDVREVSEVNERTDLCLELGQEAAYVGEVYDKVGRHSHACMSSSYTVVRVYLSQKPFGTAATLGFLRDSGPFETGGCER